MQILLIFIIAVTIFAILSIVLLSIFKKSVDKRYFAKKKKSSALDSNESRASFGAKGEMLVHRRLEEVKNRFGGYLYHDFCFEDEYGYSSEIDHILITRGGFFVIETKSNKGTIRGNEKDELWRYLKENSLGWQYFKNPLLQNWGHISHLRKTIKPNPPKMECMVIFPFADVSQIDSGYVYSLGEAIETITEITASKKYKADFVERVNHQICNLRQISKEEHQRHIKEYDDSDE